MSERNYEYQFVEVDADSIVSELTTTYEGLTGRTVRPASPERLFIAWVAAALTNLYSKVNYAANQNLPSRATGDNLDALGEMLYGVERPAAKAASTTMRFWISEEQVSAILVPRGTRVTTEDGEPIYETTADVYIAAGDLYADVNAVCQTEGAEGNGYTAGQICRCVDLYTYYDKCENLTTSDGGADEATDDEYYDLLLSAMGSSSTAGSRNMYEYLAKSVSTEITDVVVNSPSAGCVDIYAMVGSSPASAQMKTLIEEACSEDDNRPLTDYVQVKDPTTVSYNITLTYYLSTGSTESAADTEALVEAAVDDYVEWQDTKLGRDINPSKLISMLMTTGIKRVNITYPVYTALESGLDPDNPAAPEIAQVGTITLTNGGYEDE